MDRCLVLTNSAQSRRLPQLPPPKFKPTSPSAPLSSLDPTAVLAPPVSSVTDREARLDVGHISSVSGGSACPGAAARAAVPCSAVAVTGRHRGVRYKGRSPRVSPPAFG